jgi:hypothetical protein
MECLSREEEWTYVKAVVLSQPGEKPGSVLPWQDVAANSRLRERGGN